MTNLNSSLRYYLKEHLSLYIFVSVLFVMGVIFGALLVNALTLEQRQEMSQYLGSFLHLIHQGTEVNGLEFLKQAFATQLKWILLIWVLGLSVVGLPIILILDFLKGVLIGFTVGYMVAQLSWKGLLFAFVSVAPQNLIVIPAIIICSVSALAFSTFLIKNRFLQKKGSLAQPFKSYVFITLGMIGCLFVASVLESYVIPIFMKWITPMMMALG